MVDEKLEKVAKCLKEAGKKNISYYDFRIACIDCGIKTSSISYDDLGRLQDKLR